MENQFTKHGMELKAQMPAPPRYMIENWDNGTLIWFIKASVPADKQRRKKGAPGVLLYGDPHNYAIVWYNDPNTNYINKVSIVDIDEAVEILTKYDLIISAENSGGN